MITSNYENIFDSTENLIYISRGHFDELSDKLKFNLVTNSHLVLVLSSSSPRPEVSNKGSFELLKFMFLLVCVTYSITLLCSITDADATGV